MTAGAPTGYDVFLSYSCVDRASANACVTAWPRTASSASLSTGARPWKSGPDSVCFGCRAMVVLIGPKGIGGLQSQEIQLGLDLTSGFNCNVTLP
jgi:hypothetical protein